MTITEALAEIKTKGKRIDNAHASVLPHLLRDAARVDPLEKDGGSPGFVQSMRQSHNDMCEDIIKLRTAIAKANMASSLQVCGVWKTVNEWLTWRREVLPKKKAHLEMLLERVNTARRTVAQNNSRLATTAVAAPPQDIIVHFDEKAVMRELDTLINIEGALDGALSQHNATTQVPLE